MRGRLPTLSELVEKRKNQHLPFLLVSCLSLVLTVNARQWLPERFLRDNNYINLRIDTRISQWNDSFELLVSIYKFFNLASNENFLLVKLVKSDAPCLSFRSLLNKLCTFVVHIQ
jgi:hypothetical protein